MCIQAVSVVEPLRNIVIKSNLAVNLRYAFLFHICVCVSKVHVRHILRLKPVKELPSLTQETFGVTAAI